MQTNVTSAFFFLFLFLHSISVFLTIALRGVQVRLEPIHYRSHLITFKSVSRTFSHLSAGGCRCSIRGAGLGVEDVSVPRGNDSVAFSRRWTKLWPGARLAEKLERTLPIRPKAHSAVSNLERRLRRIRRKVRGHLVLQHSPDRTLYRWQVPKE